MKSKKRDVVPSLKKSNGLPVLNKRFFFMVLFFVVAAVLALIVYIYSKPASGPVAGSLDSFAKCLTEKGAVMYGTEWCPHCQNQKKMFGSSFSEVNYVDCDVSRGACTSEGITGYPTWKFIDGSSVSGTQDLVNLASRTSCSI